MTTKTSTQMTSFPGTKPVDEAKLWIKEKINQNLPIMYLNLSHKDSRLKDFDWHWFTVTGYNEIGAEFFIKAATYGKMYRLNLAQLWDTGYEQKGGMTCLAPL